MSHFHRTVLMMWLLTFKPHKSKVCVTLLAKHLFYAITWKCIPVATFSEQDEK